MSGGTHGYLYRTEPDGIVKQLSDLANMQRDLVALGYAEDAAEETETVIAMVAHFNSRLNARLKRLSTVWHAVEWYQSGDSGEDRIIDALETYRQDVEP